MNNIEKRKPTTEDYKRRMMYRVRWENATMTENLIAEELDFLNSIDWSSELFSQNGKYGFRTPSGEVILPPKFDNFRTRGNEEIDKGSPVVASIGGKWGVARADGTGDWILQPEFEFIGYPNPVTIVLFDGKWGLIRIENGEYILPPVCDSISNYGGFPICNGIGTYEKDGRFGVIGPDYDCTVAIFDGVEGDAEGYVRVWVNGQKGFINQEKTFTPDEDEAFLAYQD